MQRLKTRPQFQAALSGGTVSRTPHFALHRLNLPESQPLADTQVPQAAHSGASSAPSSAPPRAPSAALFQSHEVWLGAMVPKRWARRAVTRNAIKRQIYAISAAFEVRLPCAAHVVRLRSEFNRKEFISATSPMLKQAVRLELEQLFERAARQP